MLREWGIDASAHRPLKLSRDLCAEADAIFVMGPSYLHRVAWEYGEDLADKAYLFADPFTRPVSFGNGEYKVSDPSFDNRPTSELVKEFGWMRERVLQVRLALLGDGRRLVPLSEYFELCKTEPRSADERSVRSRRVEPGLVIDFAADGHAIGIEINTPSNGS